MRISTSVADNGLVIFEVEGEVDAHTARKLDKALNDHLARGHSRIVVDASQLCYVSSAGLRAIIFAQREASQHGGEVRVCGLQAQVRRVFEMAGLDECLHLSNSCQEALEGW